MPNCLDGLEEVGPAATQGIDEERHAVRRVILTEHNDSLLPSTHRSASHPSRRRTVRRHCGQRPTDVRQLACAGGSPVRHALGSQRSPDAYARRTSRRTCGSTIGPSVPPGRKRTRLRCREHVPDGKSRDGGVGQGVGRPVCRIPYGSFGTKHHLRFLPRSTALSTASSLTSVGQSDCRTVGRWLRRRQSHT